MTSLFDQFDFTTVVLRPYQLTKERLVIYLQDQPEKIAESWDKAFDQMSMTVQTENNADTACTAMDQRLWHILCRETPILDKLTAQDYQYLYCQYKFGTRQGLLGHLAVILRDEQGNVPEGLHEKVKSAIEHKIDFKHQDFEEFLPLKQADYRIRLLIRDNEGMLEDASQLSLS